MTTRISPAETRTLTEALSSLYATVILAGQKRRAPYTRTRRISSGVSVGSPRVEQLELGLALAESRESGCVEL